ncbi:hypothetical protein [Pseudomonas phage PhiPizzaParty]|nr:hypothetical protein [Pseudomonas phage PhiPizzaParty]
MKPDQRRTLLRFVPLFLPYLVSCPLGALRHNTDMLIELSLMSSFTLVIKNC